MAVVILLIVLTFIAAALLSFTRYKLGKNTVSCPATTCVVPVDGDPFNVLVLGSDSREGLSAEDLKYFDPTGQDRNSGQRSDSIALIHVDPKAGKAVAVALPRDLMVMDAKGHPVKINGFYNQGANAMVQEVESFTGLPISHYIEVNFASFRTITDALGGVNVRFSRDVVDPNSGLNQKKGCNTLTGNQALAFVRVRYIDNDYGRIQRQQFFIRLMMGKVLSAGTLLNPVKVVSLIDLGLGNLKHDSGLGLSTLVGLGRKFHNISPDDIDFRVVPSTPKVIGGISFDVANEAQTAALFTAIKDNAPLPPYGKQGGVGALDPSSVSVTILNGTPILGLTVKAKSAVSSQGFKVLGTGNADNTNYATTLVYYTPGNQASAQLLAQTAFPGAVLSPLPATIHVAQGDAVVVLGKNYSQPGVGPTPSPTPSASPSPAASPPPLPAGAPITIPSGVSWFSPC
ncbi:MAG: LCP family protein [Actinomycetota bacterium]